MYSLLRKTDIGSILALVVLSAVMLAHSVMHPTPLPAMEVLPSMMPSTLFYSFQKQHTLLSSILCFFMVGLLSIHINYVMIREKMFERKTFFTAFAFLWFAILQNISSFWNPAFFAALCIWLSFSEILSISLHGQPRKILFRSGALCALAIVFFLPSILFILLFLILLAFLRPFSLQEYSAWIIGLFTPLYLGFLTAWVFHIPFPPQQQLTDSFHLPVHIHHPVKSLTLVSMTLVLVVYSWVVYHQLNSRFTIGVRKKWNAVAFYLLVASLCGLFNASFPGSAWTFMLFPFCILLSLALQSNKQKVNIFTFYFIIGAALLLQWVLSK